MATKCVIEGRRLCFRPLDKRYIDHYMSWLNDPNTNRHLGPIIGALFTREKVEEWYEVMKDQNERRVFNLHTKGEENEPIGYCGLYKIDHRNDRATIQVIIGEDDYRGKGYGTEATKLLLDYGFSVLGLNTISLSFMETNNRARAVPKKLGFREAGRLRDYWKVNDKYEDRILMDIRRQEFYEKNEKQMEFVQE
ncbi:GNAT family N-acetyltransferase [Candidatus Bipolaricaulota bacterium]|nr:GNAT family N-acetyltransferase [Candidatus Bipolaricaulota bacterium]